MGLVWPEADIKHIVSSQLPTQTWHMCTLGVGGYLRSELGRFLPLSDDSYPGNSQQCLS